MMNREAIFTSIATGVALAIMILLAAGIIGLMDRRYANELGERSSCIKDAETQKEIDKCR